MSRLRWRNRRHCDALLNLLYDRHIRRIYWKHSVCCQSRPDLRMLTRHQHRQSRNLRMLTSSLVQPPFLRWSVPNPVENNFHILFISERMPEALAPLCSFRQSSGETYSAGGSAGRAASSVSQSSIDGSVPGNEFRTA